MKILYIATSFPKPDMGATIYTDLAEALFESGHDINVVVTEQKKNIVKTKKSKERGFDVLRLVTGNYYDVGIIEKGITTLRMPYLVKKGIKKYLKDCTFDLIIFESPPVTNAKSVKFAKKIFGCPAYLMLKDIFPQNAVDLGMMKRGGFIYRYFKAQENELYKTADHIGCMSKANIDYLKTKNKNIEQSKFELFPNTKKINDNIKVKDYLLRNKLNISKNVCVFLFGGNMGKPQCIDLMCEVVEKCKEDRNIFFLFVGRGTEKNKLEKTISDKKIINAYVLDNQPRNDYEQITKECDVGLIVLDSRFTVPNFPSRILSYMEYEKPVLAATDSVSDIKELIIDAKCGKWVSSEKADDLVLKIREMAKTNNFDELGKNGRKYLQENFDVRVSVEILEKHGGKR